MRVKVAVRLRPFNARELELNSQLVINMIGNTTQLTNINDPHSKPREFTFDYSFWSHDEFETRADGLLVKTGARYAD